MKPAPALKEWAVVVRALLDGEQLLDLRKGGIAEPGRRFALAARRFWLYPSYEHQRADLLKPAHRDLLDAARRARPDGDAVPIEGWADAVAEARLTDPERLAALDDRFVWTLDYAEKRLRWKRREPLFVLVLRVHRLREPILLPWREAYRGCSSWVPVEGLPGDPAELSSLPAVPAARFDEELAELRRLLEPALRPL